jgi:hypothetical protein
MSRFLRWVANDRAERFAEPFPLIPSHDPPLQPRDEAIFLLQLAAEVEHALLVQYLFGMYSIRLDGFTGPSIPANADELCSDWKDAIRTIALQEMGHLMTVQNLLLFLGGPIHFSRPIFPHTSPFYPFDFELEVLTKDSLAKYVAAEMPPVVPDALLREIIFRARGAAGGQFVNRVGALYSALLQLFDPNGPISDSDCDFTSVERQADPQHWSAHAPPDFLLLPIHSRDDAASAIERIAQQGEGPMAPSPDNRPSHFATFLGIYFNGAAPADSFPESDAVISPLEWTATLPVVRNPAVSLAEPSSTGANTIISDPFSHKWCQLFNSRYRILLTRLSHYLYESGDSLVRRTLANAAAFEMRSGLGRVANVIMGLSAGPDAAGNAGPPFEIDYDVTMPYGDANRWRLERDVLSASGDMIQELRAFPLSSQQTALLDALDHNDSEFLDFVEEQIP